MEQFGEERETGKNTEKGKTKSGFQKRIWKYESEALDKNSRGILRNCSYKRRGRLQAWWLSWNGYYCRMISNRERIQTFNYSRRGCRSLKRILDEKARHFCVYIITCNNMIIIFLIDYKFHPPYRLIRLKNLCVLIYPRLHWKSCHYLYKFFNSVDP